MRSLLPLIVALLAFVSLAPSAHAAPQKKVLALAEVLEGDGAIDERIAAAQSLGELGKRAAKATPALVRCLATDEPQLVDASVTALVAIGGKARPALEEALGTGSFEDTPIPPGPAARALLQMGKKAEQAVDAYVASATPGPELFSLFEELGDDGARFLVQAATATPEHAVEALRSLRRLAAREVRSAETIETLLKKVDDTEFALAATLCWTQEPSKRDVKVFRGWIAGDRAELVDTGLWCAGLLGRDASDAGADIVARLDAEDPTTRSTALWALASLADAGPGAPNSVVAASYPGASKKAGRAAEKANESKVYRIWRDSGKSLGYRGRVGDRSRELWALAPSWTGQVEPYPAAPDRANVASALVEAEARLVEMAKAAAADPDQHEIAALASRALSSSGASSDAVKETWAAWLSSDDADLRREALIGMRNLGRGIIEHEAAVIALLDDETTRIAAAQVLTAIGTPTSWSAVVEAVAKIEGKPPYPLLVAISRYDATALRPGLARFRELYRDGHYIMAAFLIRFGGETVEDFQFELTAGLADRRMVAAESLGHIGAAAKPALPTLQKLNERHPVSQKLLKDAIARIKASS